MYVTDKICNTWDLLWKTANSAFEKECNNVPQIKDLKAKIFLVFDGNHRLHAWLQVSVQHPSKLMYHARMRCFIFKGDKKSILELESVMHVQNS